MFSSSTILLVLAAAAIPSLAQDITTITPTVTLSPVATFSSVSGIPGGCNPAHAGSCPSSYFTYPTASASAAAAVPYAAGNDTVILATGGAVSSGGNVAPTPTGSAASSTATFTGDAGRVGASFVVVGGLAVAVAGLF